MLVILFLIWIVALAIGILLANLFKAKQSLVIGFMLSILFTLATLLFFPKILLFGKDEPLPPVTQQISPMPSEPNKKYSLNMITAMQKDAEKVNRYSNKFRVEAERAFENHDFEGISDIDRQIEQFKKSVETGRGENAKAFKICDDNIFVDLPNYTFMMSELLTGMKDSANDFQLTKTDYEKSFEACKDVVYRQTTQQIFEAQ